MKGSRYSVVGISEKEEIRALRAAKPTSRPRDPTILADVLEADGALDELFLIIGNVTFDAFHHSPSLLERVAPSALRFLDRLRKPL